MTNEEFVALEWEKTAIERQARMAAVADKGKGKE